MFSSVNADILFHLVRRLSLKIQASLILALNQFVIEFATSNMS